MIELKIFALLLSVSLSGALANVKVSVSKCCKYGEHLNLDDLSCKKAERINWELNYMRLDASRGLPRNWNLVENVRPDCRKTKVYGRGPFIGIPNGVVHVAANGKQVNVTFGVCIDAYAIVVCADGDVNSTEINRCCGDNGTYVVEDGKCSMANRTTKIDVAAGMVLIDALPGCDALGLMGTFDRTKLFPNGSLEISGTEMVIPQNGYCLEYTKLDDDSPSVLACPEYVSQPVPVKIQTDIRFTLYPIGLALSVVFLAATLVAGSLLPASHHVLHWRCQTNHVVCLLVGDVLLCITQLSGDTLGGVWCTLIAVSMHFLFLSAFFWLNTMCFNIWWTFRDLRPQNLEKSQERCRLRLYEVYAWGFPLLFAGIGAILDTLPESSYDLLRPGFAKNKCWFYGNREIFTYFFGPIGILLIVNLTLFAATARELTCGLWKRELVKSTTERAALGRVCVKLVVVMGITWLADVLSWAIGGPQEVWYLTDIINCLQGVFIFIVVGCQPQVLTAVKRYWCWRNNGAAETAGTTNHHSSSSQGLPSMGDTVCNHSITNNTKSVAFETSC